jgi:2-polyprenyl-3-methyl-5-hydroxy-6-metoxy-1,4-benzoquinol methylase
VHGLRGIATWFFTAGINRQRHYDIAVREGGGRIDPNCPADVIRYTNSMTQDSGANPIPGSISSTIRVIRTSELGLVPDVPAHRRLLRRIIASYDSFIVRAYCLIRFQIINLNMLQVLELCLRGKHKVLEVGCGFGLFGCYFASSDSARTWHGLDLNSNRIDMARRAAQRLGLTTVSFETGDAREQLHVGGRYDAVVMMDLLHHIPDHSKHQLLGTALSLLTPDGRLVIKDVTRRPAWKLFFTWVLDVLMTKGFEMWYWSPNQLKAAIGDGYNVEMYPVADWLPYPHVIYVVTRRDSSGR